MVFSIEGRMADETTMPGSWRASADIKQILALSAVIAGAYLAAGKIGLALAISNPNISAVWAPAGIAFGALLVFGLRYWPAILVGAFLTNFFTAGTVLSSLAIATGNT